MYYKIILDEPKLDEFISFLPDLTEDEVYYICLFGRHKYCASFPNANTNTFSRTTANKKNLKEKLRRWESPVGSYTRDGIVAPQESLVVYIGLNPRSLSKASKNLLIELANRIATNALNFNPISAALTEVHRATGRKLFVTFDYDDADPQEYLPSIHSLFPAESFRILLTRGGFHLIVEPAKVGETRHWYQSLAALPKCDVKGTNNLTPIPGCTQGGFIPHFLEK